MTPGAPGRWRNPGGASRREVGIIVRYLDAGTMLVARLRSMGSANPELRLFKVAGYVETQLGSTYTGADRQSFASSTWSS